MSQAYTKSAVERVHLHSCSEHADDIWVTQYSSAQLRRQSLHVEEVRAWCFASD